MCWLYDENGIFICGVGNLSETRDKPIEKRGLYSSICIIPRYLLNNGKHTISLEVDINGGIYREVHIPHCVTFETIDDDRLHPTYGKWGEIIKPDFEWQTEKIGDI